MPPDRADFGYLQNRRMSRGLACFWVCGSMRSANSIGFLRGFATFSQGQKGASLRTVSRKKGCLEIVSLEGFLKLGG